MTHKISFDTWTHVKELERALQDYLAALDCHEEPEIT